MEASMDFGTVIAREGQEAIEDLATLGYHLFGEVADPKAAGALLKDVRKLRSFDHSLFLSEAEFDARPQDADPAAAGNLLDRFEGRLAFVEKDPRIVAGLTGLLGAGYEIVDRDLVCGLPGSALPEWLKSRTHRRRLNDLGPYVRPEFRDMAYVHGADFRQDLVAHPEHQADVLTLCVYLHPVKRENAPLLLENSHRLGATTFPHKLAREWDGLWTYRDDRGQEARTRQVALTGGTGWASLWHPCTLHGAPFDDGDHERITLRYRFAKQPGDVAGIDRVNAALHGPLSLAGVDDLAGYAAAPAQSAFAHRA
jgi:hypothetical protein